MLTEVEINELKKFACETRKNIVKMVHDAKSGHPGGSLSAADIMAVLYNKSLNIPKEWDKSADFAKWSSSKKQKPTRKNNRLELRYAGRSSCRLERYA